MIIDCGTCAVRGDACTDCVVTFLTIPVRAADDTPGVTAVPLVGPGAARPGRGGAVATHPAAGLGAAPSGHDGSSAADGAVGSGAVSGGALASGALSSGAVAHGAAAPGAVDLDDSERQAIDVLAASGLVPPLRLVRAV